MAEPTHARKAVVYHTESTNSRGSMIQSSTAKKLRRTASHLPSTQTKTALYKNRSVPSVVKSLTFTNGTEDLYENLPCIVPQSAPPVLMEPVFMWSSPKETPQGAAFYEWSNGTAIISPSSSEHQDGHCSTRMASGDKQGRNERTTNPYPENLKAQNSADGASTAEDHTKWPRKPPHHLPPLDPSLFKTKSKSVKVVSSREKKTKRCVNRPTEMESSNEMSSEKPENGSKSANKTDDAFPIETVQCAEKIDLPDKPPSQTSYSIKQNSRPTCMPPDDPLGRSELQIMYRSVDGGNDNLSFHGTLKKAQTVVPSKHEIRALRRSRSISSSMELLPSRELDSRAGISKGFSIQKSRALKHSHSLRSTASPALTDETTGHGKRSNGFSIKRRVAANAPSRTMYECDRAANSGRTRRAEKPTVPLQVIMTPAISTEFQHAAGFETEEDHVVDVFPRCSSQPGPSSLNSRAYWRVRKVGLCSQAQSTAVEKDRTQARVLMKKFGTLDITE